MLRSSALASNFSAVHLALVVASQGRAEARVSEAVLEVSHLLPRAVDVRGEV